MLDVILETLIAYKVTNQLNDNQLEEIPAELSGVETQVFLLIQKYLADHKTINTAVTIKLIGKSASTARKHLSNLVNIGLLEAHGSNKNRTYSLKK